MAKRRAGAGDVSGLFDTAPSRGGSSRPSAADVAGLFEGPSDRLVGRFTSEEVGGLFDAALDGSDPEAADIIEQEILGEQVYLWVATLVNTCPRCLPVHGTKMTLREFTERGLLPDIMHDGWDSSCQCRLVPDSMAAGRKDLMEPLQRTRLKTADGKKGRRTTQRAVNQIDVDRSLTARDKALDTEEGRRTLRLLGSANKDEP